MIEYVGRFYRRLESAEAHRLERGRLYMAPVFYLPERLRVLRHNDPAREERSGYRIAEEPADIFNHAPIHETRLRRDEEILAIRAKRRPVIVAGLPAAWERGGGRLRESSVICLPVYSFQPNDSEEFRARVNALEYPAWIPLPADDALGVREGFIRLDRMQEAIERRQLDPMRLALTESAEQVVSEWTRYHLTGQIDPIMLEMRADLVSRL